MRKRILSAAVYLCMVLTLLPGTAKATEIVASDTCGANARWELDVRGTLTVSGTGEMEDYNKLTNWPIVLPTWPSDSIQSVVVKGSVTHIGSWAFSDCKNLRSVIIEEGVETIGGDAFYRCPNLEFVTLPSTWIGVLEFSRRAAASGNWFDGCPKLKTAGPMSGNYNIRFAWTEAIPNCVFNDCHSIESIVLPIGLKRIGRQAFANSKLRYVVIPEGVELIEDDAFAYCENLETVIIPEGVKKIGCFAFSGCTSLKTIALPESVDMIGEGTFYGCTSLTKAILPSQGVEFYYADDDDNSLVINTGFGRGHEVFSGCSSLVSISIPHGMTMIGMCKEPDGIIYHCSAFGGQGSIQYVGIPTSVTRIDADVFENTSITDIYYAGSEAQWNQIDYYTFPASKFATARKHFNSAVPITPDSPPIIPDPVESVGIALFPSELDLGIGKTSVVDINTYPRKMPYTLTSSDSEVVSVSGDTLTAHKPGRVEITAALVDYPNVQAVCSVAVKEGYDDLMCAIAACQLSYEDELIRYGFGATVETFADAAIGPDRTLWNWAVWDAPLSDFYKDVLGDWKIVNVASEPSGLFAVALDNAERNQRIIAFRDTKANYTYVDEFGLDLKMCSYIPSQFLDAMEFYKKNIGTEHEILLTGHSFGGAAACYVSLLTGEWAELFNAANGLMISNAYFICDEEVYHTFHGADRWNFTNHVTDSKNSANQFIMGTALRNEMIAYPNADKLPVEIHAPAITATTGAVGKNSCHNLCSMLEYDRSSGRFWLTQSTPYRQTLPEVRQFEMTRTDLLYLFDKTMDVMKKPLWLEVIWQSISLYKHLVGEDYTKVSFNYGSSGDDDIVDKKIMEQAFLLGGDGNDFLTGGCINDVLVGGLGRNAMDGGPMNDLYIVTGTSDQYINDCSGVDDIYIPSGARVRSYGNPTDKVDEYYVLTLTNGQRIMINKNRKQDFDNRFRVYSMDGTYCGSYRTVPQETETRMIALAAEDELAEAANGLPITTLEISGRDLILEIQNDAGNSVGTVNTATDSFPLYEPYGYFYYDRQEETLRAHLFGGSGEVRISSADPVAQTVACTSIFHNAEDDLPLKRFTAEIDLQASETILTPSCVVEEPAVPFRVMDSSGNTEDIPAKTEDLTAPQKPDTPEQPTHHTLTVTSGSGSGSYSAGTRISISATIPSGKRFVRWEASGGTIEDYLSASTYFVMPNRDVTLTAILTDESTGGTSGGSSGSNGWSTSTIYAVTVEKPEHGKVTSNRTNAASGSTIALTATPDIGYVLDTLTVTDSRGNEVKLTAQSGGKYTFTMPSRAVTVKATFTLLLDDTQKPCDGGADCPSRSFTDLRSVGTWYHEAVDYVLRNGLMGGYGNKTFGPNDNLSRAQLTQILFNKEGRPAVNYPMNFSDVTNEAWYTKAIRWATSQGIVGGYGNGTFGPNDNITREQLAVMLWRYAGSPAATNKELHFTDADQASGYALEALRWAVENGVITGKGGGILDPQGLATRAQVAQMLKNYLEG